MSEEITKLPAPLAELAKKLDKSIVMVLGSENLLGFEKAFLVANAISQLKEFLTPEYMKPIMALQGNKLGFKTDKDKEGGYKEDVVKNCLIEAVLFGLQPYGNQFNIIKGNMYATKEGIGSLLKNIKGLSYDMTPELPRISGSSSATVMNINWTLNGVAQAKKLEIPIKVDNFMGVDAILGKAQRKARKWLYDTITSSEIPEGDAIDTTTNVISSISKAHNVLSTPLETNKIQDATLVEEKKIDAEDVKYEEIKYDVIKKVEEKKPSADVKAVEPTTDVNEITPVISTLPEVEFGATDKVVKENYVGFEISAMTPNTNFTDEKPTVIETPKVDVPKTELPKMEIPSEKKPKIKKVKNEATLKVKASDYMAKLAEEKRIEKEESKSTVVETKVEQSDSQARIAKLKELTGKANDAKSENSGFEIEGEPKSNENPTTLF